MVNLRNLCLVVEPKRLDWGDFAAIANRMQALDPGVLVNVLTPRDTAEAVHVKRWTCKSITVAIGLSGRFTPPRGPVFEGGAVPKLEQYERFCAAGVATPRTARFEFGKRYSPDEWSEFAILKPLPITMSSQSGRTRLYRTRRLEHLSRQTLPADHFLRDGPGLVQELIDTGLYPCKWRVLSLFGDPLYSAVTRSMVARASLEASDEDIESSIIDAKNQQSKAADKDGKRTQLALDEEILAFARQVHGVFPRKPLLGIDILKRESDGRLFALEINAGANTWHFSSSRVPHRTRLGGREAMTAQLDSWTVAAKTLIRLTHEHAA